jgi:D-arabinose 5-phosphate isomerase GutQ
MKSKKYEKQKKSKIICVVAKEVGYAAKNSDIPIILKVKKKSLVTPILESVQSLIWHSIVSDPRIQQNKTVW